MRSSPKGVSTRLPTPAPPLSGDVLRSPTNPSRTSSSVDGDIRTSVPIEEVRHGARGSRSDRRDVGRQVIIWEIRNPVTRFLLTQKYAVSVLLALYRNGTAQVTELARVIGGHPATIIDTLRVLEGLKILNRTRPRRDRRAIDVRLTLRGLELVETPMSR
jgi:hypothetical protein